MRRAVGVLLLMFGVGVALGQDAPLQSGPLPDSVLENAAQASGGAAGGYRMEPGMTPPKIVQAVAADYPKDLPVIVGTVRCTLSMIVNPDGLPLFIRVVHSAGEEFDSAAIYAVRRSKFEAGLREQKAVSIRTMVRVTFTQDHAPAIPEIVTPSYKGTGDAVTADYPPKVLYQVAAEYSEEARRKKINGNVIVSVLVTEEGLPTDVRVLHGLGYGLDEKAMESIRQYKFRPAMKDGTPIAQHVTVEVNFHIY